LKKTIEAELAASKTPVAAVVVIGGDKEDWDFFDSSVARLITSAYAEIWGR
jgi:hypothetical protein